MKGLVVHIDAVFCVLKRRRRRLPIVVLLLAGMVAVEFPCVYTVDALQRVAVLFASVRASQRVESASISNSLMCFEHFPNYMCGNIRRWKK